MNNLEKTKKIKINPDKFEFGKKIKDFFLNNKYISLMDIYCDASFECNIFNKRRRYTLVLYYLKKKTREIH